MTVSGILPSFDWISQIFTIFSLEHVEYKFYTNSFTKVSVYKNVVVDLVWIW